MDSLSIIKFKAEKANALRRNPQIRKITGLIRIIELCVVLALVSRVSAQLPVAFKISTVYFRDISVVLASPRFVFLVGNAILITLFAKSGHFSAQDCSTKSPENDLYDEFAERSRKSIVVKEAKNYRRSQSESLKVNKPQPVLRRSETDMCKKIICADQGAAKNPYPEDKMSSEEFRSTIEAFIARQQRFRREEAE